MRILLSIHHELDPDGGAPGATCRLAQNYEALAHQTRILSFSSMNAACAGRTDMRSRLAFPWYVAAQLHRLGPHYDVADLSSGDGWVYASLPVRAPIVVVARSHGLEHMADEIRRRGSAKLAWKYPFYSGGYRLWEVAQSFRLADLAMFLSVAEREYAIEFLGVRPNRAVVTENGIADAFIGLPLRGHREHVGPLRVAVIGSYIERKINTSPLGIGLLLDQYPGLEFGFLGTGKPANIVQRDYVARHRSRIRVVERFAHESLPGLLADYDVLLLPSLFEGDPLVVYEAMACGLAIVASDLRTLTTRLRWGEQAMFFPAGDAHGLADAVGRVLDSETLRTTLRSRGHALAQRRSWSRIAAENLALYEEARERKLFMGRAHPRGRRVSEPLR